MGIKDRIVDLSSHVVQYYTANKKLVPDLDLDTFVRNCSVLETEKMLDKVEVLIAFVGVDEALGILRETIDAVKGYREVLDDAHTDFVFAARTQADIERIEIVG